MVKKRDLSQYQRGQITALHNEGYSQVAISKVLKVLRKAVQNALKFGESLNRKKLW